MKTNVAVLIVAVAIFVTRETQLAILAHNLGDNLFTNVSARPFHFTYVAGFAIQMSTFWLAKARKAFVK